MLPKKEPIAKPELTDISIPSRVLLGPGPSMVDARVLQAMASPVLGHLDPVFQGIMDQTMGLLRYVFQTENEMTFPISGTGTAAMEAAIAKLFLSEAFVRSSEDAMRNYGGYGYMTEFEIERDLRDAFGGVFYSGTSDMQRQIIARLLGV